MIQFATIERDLSLDTDFDSDIDTASNTDTAIDTGTATDIDTGTATATLGDEIARLSAHIHAATYALLVLIREFDVREGWGGGFRTCADWLSWRTGIAPGAAREKVRVARALADLPLISAKMRAGSLSFSKARAMTRVATPENEAELAELADHATAAHMERIVRAWRRVDRIEAAEFEAQRHASRYLRIYEDEDGMFVVRGRLDPEVGALLQKALESAEDQIYRRDRRANSAILADSVAGDTLDPTAEQRRADAIGFLSEQALTHSDPRGDSDPEDTRSVRRADRFQVMLHVNREALLVEAGGSGRPVESAESHVSAETDGLRAPAETAGLHVSAETSRRLACDAGLVEMTHDAEGQVLDVGRKRRTVSPALRRALEWRDQGCRFPGCGMKHTDAHHITHWADGGHTRLDNLVLLCRRHHRAVHEEGWSVRLEVSGGGAGAGAGGGGVTFLRPDGRLLPVVPPSPEVPLHPTAALARAHRRQGIKPDPWTATPDWGGERLDLGLAIDGLRADHPSRRNCCNPRPDLSHELD
jgi:uncharacterized protein DUF222/HNH endonuclease